MDRMLQHLSNRLKQQINPQGVTELQYAKDFHRNSKAAIVQAMAYMLSVILSDLPVFLLSSGVVSTFGSERQKKVGDIFEKVVLLLLPLQGFFNCIIFVSHKVYNYKRVNSNVGTCHVLGLLLCTSAHDPTFVSRMSIVSHHEKCRREKFRENICIYDDNGDGDSYDEDGDDERISCCDIEISDEAESQKHFRLSLMHAGKSTCGDHSNDHDDVCLNEHAISKAEKQNILNGQSPIDNPDMEPRPYIGSSDLEGDSSLFSFPSKSTMVSRMFSLEESVLQKEEHTRKHYNCPYPL
jgi:hypothetical protein